MSQPASWIADEYGGSYLNNPQQQQRDLAAAHDMAVLIQQTVQAKGGDYRRTGELINETLDELSDRAPFGFVTPAFALGMTQVLLDRANSMSGPEFVQYLEGIRDRDNPLFFWQQSTLDPLMDEVKERTRAHVEEIYGRSTFSVFEGMKGQHGPLAFGAGAADAVLEELGGGGRGLLLAASNPVEAGRQAVDMLRNLEDVPEALQQMVREAQELIDASRLDDYHKGFLTARVAIIALDAVDVIETGLSIGNLARRLRNGDVHNIGDALQALDDGPQAMRQRGQAGDANDLSAGDVPARTRTPTASPSAQAATLTDQLVDGLPANYREPYREAFTQLLRANNYDTPEEVAGFSRWLNDNPDHAVTRRYHEIAQQTMQQQMVSAYPDRVEFAYQRALDDTFRDAGANTPQDRMAYMEGFTGPNAAAFRTALDERALIHVVDNSLRQIPDNVRDAYRGSMASILSEQGYLGQGRFDPDGAQQYINNLAGAPGGPSAMAVHNRAMNIVVNGASDRFPDGTEAYYARAYRQTFEAENIRDPSAAQRYIDNLDAAPNGAAMRAVHNRAVAAIVDDVVDTLPQNLQPAYARALRLSLDQAGADTPAEALSHVRNLTDGRQVQSVAALHQRAFDSVVQSAVSSIDEPSRPAYTQALRESLDAGGRGPARNADGSPVWDYGSVERAQQYVIDLANSPQAMQRIHDRADEVLGRSRTPDATPPVQTPPQDRVDPSNGTQPAAQTPPQDRVDSPNNTPPQNPPPNDRQTPDPDQRQLPPASQPDDPLLPFHARPREERMLPPAPLEANGQRFDVMGVDEDGRVRLRPEGQRVGALPAEAMFEMRATTPQALAEPGNAVLYGRDPWLTDGVVEAGQRPGVAERSYVLRDPQNPERTTLVPESRAAEIFTPVGREVSYQGDTWRFQALQSPGWQQGVEERGFQLAHADGRTQFVPENRAVDIRMQLGEEGDYRFGDVRHGVIRMLPMEPDRDFTMPLAPGMSFEARLRDREMEGAYRITVGENGELTATGRIRNGTEVTQRIEASDIAPRYVDVRSPDFNDSFQVDSFAHREATTRNRAISTEPTGLPLRDPAFGNLDGNPGPQLALGAQSLETQADFIRRNAGNLEPGQTPTLTVFNIAFSNEGEARRVLDAMSDFREMHGPDAQIRIVAYEPSFRSFEGEPAYRELQQIIERDRIQVEFFGNDPAQREVIHAKGVAVNDQVLFSTGAVIDGSRNKADISVQLPPDAARAFNAYLNEAVIGDADVGRRQQLAADAAREGVLINDPEARLPYIARAQDGLIRGAERELTVSVSELRNPETTRAIIERAEAGVNVQVQFREMDPESRQLLADAQQRLPNLQVEDVSAWQPRPHYNVIVADREQAYVGTAYLWQNQQDMLQHGRSFENGVLLQGDSVRQLQSQMEGLRFLQPPNPGLPRLNPAAPDAPDVGVQIRNDTTGSISISAPANSSIGVDVQNSTTGTIQTVSGSGNVQVSGDGLQVDGRTVRPDANGNVQVTDGAGLGITLNNPGTSGNTGTRIRLEDSEVQGTVQAVIGTGNVQISGTGNEVRVDPATLGRGSDTGTVADHGPIRIDNDQTFQGAIANGNNNVSVIGRDNRVGVEQGTSPVPDTGTDRSVATESSVENATILTGNENAAVIGDANRLSVTGPDNRAEIDPQASSARGTRTDYSVSIGQDAQTSTIVTGNENVAVIGSENRVGVAANDRQVAMDGSEIRVEPRAGNAQSIIGDRNTQIDASEAQINGDRRQTVIDGDNNRQTQNLGANVTAESVTQTIDGRSDSRQQIGDDATVRPRDDIAPTRPQPLRSGDRSYDIVGVNDGERPSLEVVTHNAVPRYVPTDALVPRPPGEPHPDARARQVEVVTAGAQGEVREPYEIAGVRRDGLLLNRPGESGGEPRFVPYADPAARIEFAFPNGSTYIARQTVDGSVRFDPAESERTRIPLEPGMQFEARLRGRETEGHYRIDVGADFALSARSTDPARAGDPAERISVSDIAPTWQRVTSTTAPDTELFVDSAQYRRAAQRVGREGELDYPIGTLDGESVVRHGFANQLYRPVLDALRDPATTGDVSIAMYGIGTSREGRQYTDALTDYARRNPDAQITIHSGDVQIDGRRGEALRDWLSEQHPNIRISEPLPPSNFNVPHEKIVAIDDRVFIGSEKIGTSMSRKVGFMAEMGAEESQLMHSYIQGLGDPRTDAAQTRQTLTSLAERGVLIDDPRAGFYSNTAAMNRVLDEAQGHLRIYQSDLIDTVATQRIIDRARDGVQVDLRYRDIDPQSQRMLEQAAGDLPNLRFQRVPNDPVHPIYQHENYVISERGGVLSSAYMWEPKAGQVPRYTNGGEGGVLLDPQQARQYERYLDTAPTRQIGPGAILDLGEEAWNKLSPRLLEQLDRLRPQTREGEPASREQTPPANDNRQSSLPDPAAPTQSPREPGLDDPRHPNHTMFASALDRIQTFERDRGIDSGDFARNLAGSLTVSAVESRLPQINHVVFNAEATRAFAVDTPNLDAEWRRVAYTDVAGAGQQTLAASSERLRELQSPALSPAAAQHDMQQRPDEQARNAARMA